MLSTADVPWHQILTYNIIVVCSLMMQCTKDCENGDDCGGLASSHNMLFDNLDNCCSMLFWKDRSECV